jgi:poly(hydroxyalkanoate) depolymerase family esterase
MHACYVERMPGIDWQELYAQNRAAIQRSGVRWPQAITPAAAAAAAAGAGAAGGERVTPRGDINLRGNVEAPGEYRTFTVGGRERQALVYAPPRHGVASAAPLICMLHGCTQNATAFAAATKIRAAADRHGFAVLLPEQDRADNPMRCWNWFSPEHQERGRGEPSVIAAILTQLLADPALGIDRRRVFVCGLSSGGAMAAILAATYPDLFSAAAIHSGLAYRSASDVGSAHAAMANGGGDPGAQARAAYAAMGPRARAVPTMVIHGSDDRTVAPINARLVLRQAMAANRLAAPDGRLLDEHHPDDVVAGQVQGGHAYTRTRWTDHRGALMHELLLVDGLGHAWSGGLAGGSHTDPRGPDATDAIVRFFAEATS